MWHALWTRFRKDPVQNTLLLSVFAIHCVFVLIILISPTFTVRKKNHKPLIVKTIVPKQPSKTVAVNKSPPRQNVTPVTQAPAPKKKEAPKTEMAKAQVQSKKEAPVNPTLVKKATTVKKEPAIADKTLSKNKTPPSIPAAKKNPPMQERAKISDSLLQELEESIAKMENKNSIKRAVSSSKAVTPMTLQIDTPTGEDLSSEETDYADLLVGHLHQSLSLPDYGEVKIQLRLRQDGTVAKLVVLKTQSEKNKQYLENNLPRLLFPRFDGAYANKKEYAFILTFCNE